jgi:hypothetical protein
MKKRLFTLVLVLVATLWIGSGGGVAASELQPVDSAGGCTCVQSKVSCDNMSGKRVCWTECTAWQCDM